MILFSILQLLANKVIAKRINKFTSKLLSLKQQPSNYLQILIEVQFNNTVEHYSFRIYV